MDLDFKPDLSASTAAYSEADQIASSSVQRGKSYDEMQDVDYVEEKEICANEEELVELESVGGSAGEDVASSEATEMSEEGLEYAANEESELNAAEVTKYENFHSLEAEVEEIVSSEEENELEEKREASIIDVDSEEEIENPDEDINSADDIDSLGDIDNRDVVIDYSDEEIENPDEEIDNSDGDIEKPDEDIDNPAEDIDNPDGIETPEADMGSSDIEEIEDSARDVEEIGPVEDAVPEIAEPVPDRAENYELVNSENEQEAEYPHQLADSKEVDPQQECSEPEKETISSQLSEEERDHLLFSKKEEFLDSEDEGADLPLTLRAPSPHDSEHINGTGHETAPNAHPAGHTDLQFPIYIVVRDDTYLLAPFDAEDSPTDENMISLFSWDEVADCTLHGFFQILRQNGDLIEAYSFNPEDGLQLLFSELGICLAEDTKHAKHIKLATFFQFFHTLWANTKSAEILPKGLLIHISMRQMFMTQYNKLKQLCLNNEGFEALRANEHDSDSGLANSPRKKRKLSA